MREFAVTADRRTRLSGSYAASVPFARAARAAPPPAPGCGRSSSRDTAPCPRPRSAPSREWMRACGTVATPMLTVAGSGAGLRLHRRRFDERADLLGERDARRRASVSGIITRELLAAVARREVGGADRFLEDRRNGLQHFVADGVAVRVVDLLEEIEVDDGQRQRPLVALPTPRTRAPARPGSGDGCRASSVRR